MQYDHYAEQFSRATSLLVSLIKSEREFEDLYSQVSPLMFVC